MRLLSTCKDCGNAKDIDFPCQYCLSSTTKPSTDLALVKNLPNKPKSLITKVAIFIVSIPALAFALGLALEFIIPGCHCTELGSHCSTCGSLGQLVQLLKFGGLSYTMFALVLGLPLLAVIAICLAIISLFTKARE